MSGFRTLAFLLLTLPAALPAAAQPQPTVLVSADMRPAQSLNGQWHFIVDPYRNGWGGWPNQPAQPEPHGFISDPHSTPTGPLHEWDWAKEPTLAVPGDWNSQRPELLYYEGLLWYQRTLTYHAKPGTRAFLHFGAADYQANVAVNGTNLCEHQGGYTSFDCDATALLHDGENSLVVAVDNTRERDRVPTTKTDWWNYGGLTGEVSLITVPDTYIDDESVRLDATPAASGSAANSQDGPQNDPENDPENDSILATAHLTNAPAGTPVTLSIPALGVHQSARTGANGVAALTVHPQNLELWSPDHPHLYAVAWSVGANAGSAAGGDTLRDEVGFRTIAVQGSKILLNGKPLFLRGVSMHAEVPRHWPTWPAAIPDGHTGRAASDADARLLFGWAKQLDCNFVRLAHYPYPEPFLREADRMGLLVWSEIPVYWAIDWTSPAAYASASAQLHEMIRRDHNHAAIALWSMSNETQPSPERTAFLRRLITQARGEDPSRLITSAISTPLKKDADGRYVGTLDDPIVPYLDVLGYNEYIGWYSGTPDDAPRSIWRDPTGKPLLMSEFGGGAVAGRHGPQQDRWTEEYQAHLMHQQFQLLSQLPFLAGATPWMLMDMRSPTRNLPGVQNGYNRKGLVSNTGVKKEAFGVVRQQYEAKRP